MALNQLDPTMSLQQAIGKRSGRSPDFMPPTMQGGGAMDPFTPGPAIVTPPLPPVAQKPPQPSAGGPTAGMVDAGYGFGNAGNGFQWATQALADANMAPPAPAPQPPMPAAQPPVPQPPMPAAQPPAPLNAVMQKPPSGPSPWSSSINNQRLSNVIQKKPAQQSPPFMPPSTMPFQGGGFQMQPPVGPGKKRPGNY